VKALVSLLFGALVGISGTFLHNSYRPFGLIVSLLALVLGLRLMRNMYRSKFLLSLFVCGWIFIVVRASTLGNGGEVLIEANLYGNLLVFGGVGLLVIGLLQKIKN
jgi:hypothetical protein